MGRIRREEGRALFGADPEAYERGRPGHPDRVYELLATRCGLVAGARVLEIGPGTGKATRRLLEMGGQVVAVEPDLRLAEYLAAELGSLDVVNRALEDADLQEAGFDLAVAASSFHWVDEERGLTKLAAALRPGGWLALWWTLYGDEQHRGRFRDAVDELTSELCGGDGLDRSPSAGAEGRPRFALDVEARLRALEAAGFEHGRHEVIRWDYTWDTAGITSLYSSFSPVLKLDERTRHAFLDAVADLADRDFGGRVELTLLTSLYIARRPAP